MTNQLFLDGRVELRPGDCRDVIKAMPDNSVDAVVTDPPYALVSIQKRFGKPGSAAAQHGTDGLYARASAGFMGKQWDTGETAFAAEFWAEVLRVLKPGGHVAAFSGTRTYHRMAVAIEDAGFEIRDQLAWCYGSGFPKSHAVDVGLWKGVLNCQSKESAPLVVQLSAFTHLKSSEAKEHIVAAPALILPEGVPALIMEIGKAGGSSEVTVMSLSESEAGNISLSTGWSWESNLVDRSEPRSMYTTETNAKQITTAKTWKSLTSLITRKSTLRSVTLQNGWTWPAITVASSSKDGNTNKNAIPILTVLESATWNPVAQAKGTGTSLKPSWEPICLARKPLIGTVAENVLEHGTGALNIDGCRVGDTVETWPASRSYGPGQLQPGGKGKTQATGAVPAGRWPANIVHDGSEEVVACFPDAPGQQRQVGPQHGAKTSVNTYGDYGPRDDFAPRLDSGSAARFFYSAKADKNDRLGSKHPTVKPVDLMQWLVRLVTPKGGLVLDPFAGSGSTGEAAWREGMRCILVEREEEYQADIARRMELADKGPATRKAATARPANDNLPLFGNTNAA
ncbi:DNA methyltransferase [Nitratireductor kimnyeongensis]|uniref:site-specific DNA-methyltransferase (adenine-specific) n=1 Tax=Nitratireductor kimnyeongensis TaxID=430679 RepID=A0ABW0T676_9HYPH|nr:DNA methyltransferase [Nitratireductor kimnyeongensis]QZZ34558.1 site-specific DNA-methyltransferase [Nitratireductor kimnyeongensis]